LAVKAVEWKVVSIEDYGAKGDNATDNTKAFRNALLAVEGGGEVLVPGPVSTKIFQTAPINLTSNVVLRVEGTMRAVEDKSKFPVIDVLPSVGHDYDTNGPSRYHPFVFAVDGSNITIAGEGTIDGAGAFWWGRDSRNENHGIGRPHLLELHNISGAEVTGVTLLDSAFWTFHPVYCTDLHIHHMEIQVPWGMKPNPFHTKYVYTECHCSCSLLQLLIKTSCVACDLRVRMLWFRFQRRRY
jgi:polygalacturonase